MAETAPFLTLRYLLRRSQCFCELRLAKDFFGELDLVGTFFGVEVGDKIFGHVAQVQKLCK